MRCRQCGEECSRAQCGYDEYPYGDRKERVVTHAVCPFCGSEDMQEECFCVQCGEEVHPSDLSDGFCRFCAQELEQTLEWVRSMLTPAQQQWMIRHPEWIERGDDVC